MALFVNKKRTGEVEEYYPERDMSETIQMMPGILTTHQVCIYLYMYMIWVNLVLSETYLNIRTKKQAFKLRITSEITSLVLEVSNS